MLYYCADKNGLAGCPQSALSKNIHRLENWALVLWNPNTVPTGSNWMCIWFIAGKTTDAYCGREQAETKWDVRWYRMHFNSVMRLLCLLMWHVRVFLRFAVQRRKKREDEAEERLRQEKEETSVYYKDGKHLETLVMSGKYWHHWVVTQRPWVISINCNLHWVMGDYSGPKFLW